MGRLMGKLIGKLMGKFVGKLIGKVMGLRGLTLVIWRFGALLLYFLKVLGA